MSATTAAEQLLAEKSSDRLRQQPKRQKSRDRRPGRLLLLQQLKLTSHSCNLLRQQLHLELIWSSAPFAEPQTDESLEMLFVSASAPEPAQSADDVSDSSPRHAAHISKLAASRSSEKWTQEVRIPGQLMGL